MSDPKETVEQAAQAEVDRLMEIPAMGEGHRFILACMEIAKLKAERDEAVGLAEAAKKGAVELAERLVKVHAERVEFMQEAAGAKTRLDVALRFLSECADDLEAAVKDRWMPDGEVHPANERRLWRDMGPVANARAILAKHRQQAGEGDTETCPRCGYTEEDKRIHGDHYLCAEDPAQQSVKRLCDRQQAGEK